jgi:hypothetical protein
MEVSYVQISKDIVTLTKSDIRKAFKYFQLGKK